MTLTRWFALIGIVVGLGCLQVAQRNAVVLKGYAVGERLHRVQERETDLLLVKEHVVGMTSPSSLARIAQERQLTFVAWSTLSSAPENLRVVAATSGTVADADRAAAQWAAPLVRLAADDQTAD